MKAIEIAELFVLDAAPVSAECFGSGHINATYLVEDGLGHKYVMQRINDNAFKDVPGLMRNILAVTEFLNSREPGSSLEFLKAKDGLPYCHTDSGYYRLYRFVDGLCLDSASNASEMETCGLAFGGFQRRLDGFDASVLGETIPRFHDTPNRLRNLEAAAAEDKFGRLRLVKDEYDFLCERKSELSTMLDLLREGKLIKRVTHNDTKINNVLLDSVTHAPKCVIDLDTVMPGLAANDFGDCIRSGATTAAEDEKDVGKVGLNMEYYAAFARGFLRACGASLTKDEIRTLPIGAKFMTYECAARFLTDYLEGNVYYHVSYEEHNLVRCRTQIKLIRETERRMNEINAIIEREANRL